MGALKTAPRAYFFGCIGTAGHYMFSPTRQVWSHSSPWGAYDIDTREPPAPPGEQTEGPARLHHKDGWTMLSTWDRSVDKRHGSHANFIFEGVLNFDAALARAEETFPSIVARLTNPITEWAPDS